MTNAVRSLTACVFGAVAMSAVRVASAADLASGCLRFEEAIALSAERAPAVAAAEAERAEAAADLKDARSLYRPKLTAFGRTGLGDVGADNSVVQNQLGLRASQRLYDFGDARFARAAARLEEQSRSFGVAQSRLEAAADTGLTILDRLEAHQKLQATADRRKFFARLSTSVEGLLARGAATRADLADVGARLAEADALVLELQFFIDRADTAIALDTGREDPACAGELANAFLALHAAAIVSPDDASALALAASPALKTLELRAKSAEQARRRESRSRLPTIEAVAIGAYASGQDDGEFDLQNRVGIDLSLPLYSGAALSARNDRAGARAALANAEAARVRREIEESARIGFQRLSSLQSQLISRRAAEIRKRDALDAAETEHKVGLRTLPELIDSRVEFEEASLARIETEFELLRQRIDLLVLTNLLPIESAPASAEPQ